MFVDPDSIQPTATEVKVLADSIEGVVTGISERPTLSVLPTGQTSGLTFMSATVPRSWISGTTTTMLNFGDIKVNDQLKIFGLKAGSCNSDSRRLSSWS